MSSSLASRVLAVLTAVVIAPVVQVLVSRLPPDPGDGGFGRAALQGADLRAVHGQVRGVRQDERPRGVQAQVLLYDGR